MRVLLPEGAVEDFAGVPADMRDYALYSVAGVCRQMAMDPDAPRGTAYPLCWEGQTRVVPRAKVTESLRIPQAKGVLMTDGSYQAGRGGVKGQARRYALTPEYQGRPFRRHWLSHPELCRNYARFVARRDQEIAADDTLSALRRHLDAVALVGDPPVGGDDHALNALAEGLPWFHIDEFGHRLHTPITALWGDHRRHVRLAGSPLMSVDVCASQPTLIGLWANGTRPTWAGGPGGGPGWKGEEGTHGRRREPFVSVGSSELGETDSWLVDARAEKPAESIYGRLMAETGWSRERAKKELLTYLYGESQLRHSVAGQVLTRLYPRTTEAIYRAKIGPPIDQHKALSCLMQRWESWAMLRVAAARLCRERPGVPFLTVHDAVLCRPEDSGLVGEVIRGAWRDTFGVAPRVKVSEWAS